MSCACGAPTADGLRPVLSPSIVKAAVAWRAFELHARRCVFAGNLGACIRDFSKGFLVFLERFVTRVAARDCIAGSDWRACGGGMMRCRWGGCALGFNGLSSKKGAVFLFQKERV